MCGHTALKVAFWCSGAWLPYEDVDLWHRAHKALQEIWVSLVANKDAVGSTEVFILLIHLSAIG